MRRGTRSRALGGFSETARRLLDAGIIRDAGQRILGVSKPRTMRDPAISWCGSTRLVVPRPSVRSASASMSNGSPRRTCSSAR